MLETVQFILSKPNDFIASDKTLDFPYTWKKRVTSLGKHNTIGNITTKGPIGFGTDSGTETNNNEKHCEYVVPLRRQQTLQPFEKRELN